MKKKIIPYDLPTPEVYQYVIGAIAPRPIAFVSSVDEKGVENLAPYSFFNAFSTNPPILVFSSNRRVGDNTIKDTLHNVQVTRELVINMVNYKIVRQMSLASVEFPSSESEFAKSGLTPIKAEKVKAPMVRESPINMECKVKDIVPLGDEGGAGHLIICEILLMHIDKDILTEKNRIDPHKADLMGRMGRAYYVRASGDAVHTIYQPMDAQIIGWDHLPERITNSERLTGNEVSQMAALTEWPTDELIAEMQTKFQEDKEGEASRLIAEGQPMAALALMMG